MPSPRSLVIEPSVLYFGTPVALVSTLNPDGTTNLSPMSSAWSLGDRLVLGFGTRGRAYENLVRHAECVVNLPSADLVAHVERLAPTTGVAPVPEAKAAMGYRHEADKFSVAGLTPAPSHDVAPERVADCPLQIEARVLDVRPLTVVPGEPDSARGRRRGSGRARPCTREHRDCVDGPRGPAAVASAALRLAPLLHHGPGRGRAQLSRPHAAGGVALRRVP